MMAAWVFLGLLSAGQAGAQQDLSAEFKRALEPVRAFRPASLPLGPAPADCVDRGGALESFLRPDADPSVRELLRASDETFARDDALAGRLSHLTRQLRCALAVDPRFVRLEVLDAGHLGTHLGADLRPAVRLDESLRGDLLRGLTVLWHETQHVYDAQWERSRLPLSCVPAVDFEQRAWIAGCDAELSARALFPDRTPDARCDRGFPSGYFCLSRSPEETVGAAGPSTCACLSLERGMQLNADVFRPFWDDARCVQEAASLRTGSWSPAASRCPQRDAR